MSRFNHLLPEDWLKDTSLEKGQLSPILQSITIRVTFLCAKVLHVHFHLSIVKQVTLGGEEGSLPASRKDKSILQWHDDKLLHFGRGIFAHTVDHACQGDKDPHSWGIDVWQRISLLPNHKTLRFTDSTAPRDLKQTSFLCSKFFISLTSKNESHWLERSLRDGLDLSFLLGYFLMKLFLIWRECFLSKSTEDDSSQPNIPWWQELSMQLA